MKEHFEAKVGLHQGSAVSQLLFNIVFKIITENVREETPRCVLYADDILLMANSRRELERKLEEWRLVVESRGMRISRSKTEYFTKDVDGDQLATIKLDFKVDGIIGEKCQECCAAPLKKLEEKKLDVAEMKMLRWMVGITRRNRIRNVYSGSSGKFRRQD
ncbi:uncharacterized protein LOC119577582 [Penaeus monodon]|uniref:uncharacterized protein LOC119577582 n=1 Tax=Penaeus monodon TaxID=6687 RepID=UPI0018A70757|nr:uncharacterized protein LOC119577582 [Penaeus monodon]